MSLWNVSVELKDTDREQGHDQGMHVCMYQGNHQEVHVSMQLQGNDHELGNNQEMGVSMYQGTHQQVHV